MEKKLKLNIKKIKLIKQIIMLILMKIARNIRCKYDQLKKEIIDLEKNIVF